MSKQLNPVDQVFVKLPIVMLSDPHLTPYDKLVYMAVRAFARVKEGKFTVWPSVKTIASVCAVSERQAQASLNKLCGQQTKKDKEGGVPKRKVLSREKRSLPGKKENTSSLTTLLSMSNSYTFDDCHGALVKKTDTAQHAVPPAQCAPPPAVDAVEVDVYEVDVKEQNPAGIPQKKVRYLEDVLDDFRSFYEENMIPLGCPRLPSKTDGALRYFVKAYGRCKKLQVNPLSMENWPVLVNGIKTYPDSCRDNLGVGWLLGEKNGEITAEVVYNKGLRAKKPAPQAMSPSQQIMAKRRAMEEARRLNEEKRERGEL